MELVDIFPTILELSGISSSSGVQGESLARLIRTGEGKKNRYAFAESYFASLQFGISPLLSVQDLEYKYIEAPRAELYSLKKDARRIQSGKGGTNKKEKTQRLKQILAQYKKTYLQGAADNNSREVSAEEAEQFAALGYLGGSVPESEWDLKRDPKDYIDDWNASLHATQLLDLRDYKKALPLIQKVKSSLPQPDKNLNAVLLEARCSGNRQFSKSGTIASTFSR